MEWILYPIIIFMVWIFAIARKPHVPDLREELGAVKRDLQLSRAAAVQNGALVLELQEKLTKVTGQKKSSEVKTGQIVEQLVGFLDDFPYPEAEIKALYQPVDLIVFKEDEVVFVEVKSGESNLSEKQRKIRDLIEAKKVRFEVHRVNEKGYKIK